MEEQLMHHSKALSWLTGPYETGSERPAIELLTGDDDLMRFLNGALNDGVIIDKMKEEERQWIEMTEPSLIYPKPQVSIFS